MNHIPYRRRETGNGRWPQFAFWLFMVILVSVVAALFIGTGVADGKSGGNGFPVMLIWVAIIILITALLGFGKQMLTGGGIANGVFALIVVVAGFVTAYFSGDRFDVIRATIFSIIFLSVSFLFGRRLNA